MKVGIITIVGRPSTGKSSLINAICGEIISIVTPIPQTTRNSLRGIRTDARGQLVFVDTPGFHHSERRYNKRLNGIIFSNTKECDCVLYLVDLLRDPGKEEYDLLSQILELKIPLLIAYNKIDACSEEAKSHIPQLIRKRIGYGGGFKNGRGHVGKAGQSTGFSEIMVSATEGLGIEELVNEIFTYLPNSDNLLYPANRSTDRNQKFRITEIIREQAMLRVPAEIPHAIRVEIIEFELHEKISTESKRQGLWIRAQILVESKSQVGLVVGKGGLGIREIRRNSQKKIGKIFPYRVELDLRVKHKGKWRSKDEILQKIMF